MEELTAKEQIRDGIVFVEVYSSFCNNCKKQVKIIEGLQDKYESIKFLKVNSEESLGAELCNMCDFVQAPSMAIFYNGELINKFSGLTIPNKLEQILQETLEQCK